MAKYHFKAKEGPQKIVQEQIEADSVRTHTAVTPHLDRLDRRTGISGGQELSPYR